MGIIKDDKVIASFFGYGDAAPNSVSRFIVPHIIRMAETRGKARALRILTDVGMTAIEELDAEGQSTDNLSTTQSPRRKTSKEEKPVKSEQRKDLENKLKEVADKSGMSTKAVINAINHILEVDIKGLSEVTEDGLVKVIAALEEEQQKLIQTSTSTPSLSPLKKITS